MAKKRRYNSNNERSFRYGSEQNYGSNYDQNYGSNYDRSFRASGDRMYGLNNNGINHAPDHFNDEIRQDKDPRGGAMGFNSTLAERANRNEFYAGMEPRRRQELEDAGMIHEDHRAVANLPQEVMIRPYPRTGPWMPEGINDTLEGVDMQMDYDDSQRRAHFYPKKV